MIMCRPLLLGCLALWLTACSSQSAPPASPPSEPPLYMLLAQAEAARQQATSETTPQASLLTLSQGKSAKAMQRDEPVIREPLSHWRSNGRYRATGTASWLARNLDGRATASGERMNSQRFTAAHRSLPLGTYVRVTNLANGRQVIVKINDRGPFNRHLLIDVTHAAAVRLGMHGHGKARVRVESVSRQAAKSISRATAKQSKVTQPLKGKRIQLASGSHREKLEATGRQLQRQFGLPAQVIPSGRQYRLVLGPVPTAQQQRVLRQLKAKGYRQAFLTN